MAYDPQASRRRPKPLDSEPAPVDALLDEEPSGVTSTAGSMNHDGPKPEDPPPGPGVTPNPADPVPDVVVASTGVAAGLGAGVVLVMVLRWIWKRRRESTGTTAD